MPTNDDSNDKIQTSTNEANGQHQEHREKSSNTIEQDFSVEKEERKTDIFVRQVSVDSSTANMKVPSEVRVKNTTVSSNGSSAVTLNESQSTVGSSTGNAAKDWGWFEDIHDQGNNKSPPSGDKKGGSKKTGGLLFNDLDSPPNDLEPKKDTEDGTMMAVTAPTYVLEESKSSQKLWKNTAGTRPPQPVDERAFYEKIWANNFKRSQVDYRIPSDILTATSPINLSPFADRNFDEGYQTPDDFNNREGDGTAISSEVAATSSVTGKATAAAGLYGIARSKNPKEQLMGPYNHHHTLVNKTVKNDETDDEMTVLVRGDNVFGTTVSKSFTRDIVGIDTVSISIASYRVVECKKHGKYAQFLVIFCEGTFRDTIGVWKRYSDFEKLSRIVSHGHENCTSVLAGIHPLSVTEDPHQEMLPNAVTSWNLLRKRKRWYRCLEAGYLSLKAFLLERFLHDILFESSTAEILRSFVGLSDDKEAGQV